MRRLIAEKFCSKREDRDGCGRGRSWGLLFWTILLVFSFCFQYARRVPAMYRHFDVGLVPYIVAVLTVVSVIYARRIDDRFRFLAVSLFVTSHFVFTHLIAKPFFFPTSSWLYFKQIEGIASQGGVLLDPTYNQDYLTILPYLGELILGYSLYLGGITDPLAIYYVAESVSAVMRLGGAILCFMIIRELGFSFEAGLGGMVVFALSANELQGYILNYTTSMASALAGFYLLLRFNKTSVTKYLWLSLGVVQENNNGT